MKERSNRLDTTTVEVDFTHVDKVANVIRNRDQGRSGLAGKQVLLKVVQEKKVKILCRGLTLMTNNLKRPDTYLDTYLIRGKDQQ